MKINFTQEFFIQKTRIHGDIEQYSKYFNAAVGAIMSRETSTIVIDNFDLNFQNIALLELARVIGQVSKIGCFVYLNRGWDKIKLKKAYPEVNFLSYSEHNRVGGLYLSPKMMHDHVNPYYSDGRYHKIDFYPFINFGLAIVKQIAFQSPLKDNQVAPVGLADDLVLLYEMAEGKFMTDCVLPSSTSRIERIAKTVLRIISMGEPLTPKFEVVEGGYEGPVSPDVILLYTEDAASKDNEVRGRRKRASNTIRDIEQFREEGKRNNYEVTFLLGENND